MIFLYRLTLKRQYIEHNDQLFKFNFLNNFDCFLNDITD